MDRDGALALLVIGVAGYFVLKRQTQVDVPAVDQSVLDARDAMAQDAPAVDQSVLDARDALAQAGIATVDTGSYYDDVQYDQLGNVIGVGFWSNVMWTESKIPPQYLQPIRAAEAKYGMPRNLLARQVWQESQYNPNAVNPNSGAQGIAQFMPATAASLGIDPFNALQAIDAAGRYMRQLYNATGTWLLALAAYNWGIGNVKNKGIAQAPTETRNYYTKILADIGMGPTTA